jgi:hypothetical protein
MEQPKRDSSNSNARMVNDVEVSWSSRRESQPGGIALRPRILRRSYEATHSWIHLDRAPGGHCDHFRADRLALTRGASGAQSGTLRTVRQSSSDLGDRQLKTYPEIA